MRKKLGKKKIAERWQTHGTQGKEIVMLKKHGKSAVIGVWMVVVSVWYW